LAVVQFAANSGQENAMNILIAAVVLSVALMSQATLAEDNASAGNTQNSNGDGGANNQMGSNGWSGGHKSTSPGHPDVPTPADSLDKQPPVVTGLKLDGPPKAFPSNKAPE